MDYDEVRGLPGTGQSASFPNEVFWLDGETKDAMRQRHPEVALPYRQPLLRNLGQIATMLKHLVEAEDQAYDDLDAFYAPSECWGDVSRGYRKQAVALVETIEKCTGFTAQELEDEFKARCSGRWLHFNQILGPIAKVVEERAKEEHERLHLKFSKRPRLV